MLSEATSGFSLSVGCRRSSIDMVGAPPVVKLITTSLCALILRANWRKSSGSCVGRPSFGSRACRCTIAAPAFAAPIAASAISSGVIGRCGDMVGVWIAPVTAHVMMTLPCGADMAVRLPCQKSILDEVTRPAADWNGLAGNMPAGLGGEEQCHVGDVLRRDGGVQGNALEHAVLDFLERHAQ